MAKPHEGPQPRVRHVLGEPTLEGLANYIQRHDIRKILCLVGAGASVQAGIPDFRSPKTGIYAKLGKYRLNDPTEAFSLALLREDPSIFFSIVTEMDLWPGSHRPTAVHHFLRLLADEGRLLRCCTQNIDGLEGAAGLAEGLLVEAHGTFHTATCIDCRQEYDTAQLRCANAGVLIWRCTACGSIVKPDVVFFGESLPERFFDVFSSDTKEADLVIIIGTSLQVRPFALLPMGVRSSVPRVIFNLERVGGRMFYLPEDVMDEKKASGREDSSSASSAAATHAEDDGIAMNGNAAATLHGNCDFDRNALEEPLLGEVASDSSSSSSEGFITEHEEALLRPAVCRDLLIRGDCQESIMRFAECLGLGERLRDALLEHDAR
ncbi:unnamed protein product [Phytomonas sp. Hart1]|nr:unnamed protein product [Phytomonas sp. Hart1]|eukprot:CCW70223.1 unnamed protein product [Phytomonas sp. isolate Hart1]